MNTRKPLDCFAMIVMVLLCLCWGFQQTAIKLAATSIGPMMQIALRSIFAVVLLGGFMLWRGDNSFAFQRNTLLGGISAGVLFALEYVCVAIGLMYTTASHITVFLYTAPFFTALGLHCFIPHERLRASQFLGIMIAFTGIVLAFLGGFSTSIGTWKNILIGDVLGILGGVCWAATTVVIRCSHLSEAPAQQTLMYQLIGCSLILLPIAFLMPTTLSPPITAIAWGSLIFQTVIFCFVSLLVWFWMLKNYLVSRLSVFTFLTPLFGVSFGVLLLNDPVNWQFMSGSALVLIGIIVVNFR